MQKPLRRRRFSKRARWMMAVGALLAVAAALVLLLPTIKARYPDELTVSMQTVQTHKMLETGDTNVLDTITVTHEDGESYTLLYRDQQLYLAREGSDAELINESYSDDIVAAATQIAVTDTVAEDASEVSEHLADMGLEPPKIIVKVSYANGYEVELQLGEEVPDTTYHYYRWSGDEGVYMCDIGIYEAFAYTAQMLLPVEQPTLVPGLIDQVSLRTADGGLMEVTFVTDGAGTYLGTLKVPYEYPMNSEDSATLMSALKNFRLGTFMGTVDASNRAAYGFDSPIAVLDVHQQAGLYTQIDSDGVLQTLTTAEVTFRFTLGAKDGDYFYFCEYAGECYRVSSFLVTSFLNADTSKYLTRTPADMGPASIASITVETETGKLDVRASYTEHVLANNQIETDTDGNVVYDISVTINGEPVAQDVLTSLVNSLQQMTVSGTAHNAESPSGTPHWQMTLTTVDGATRTLIAYPLDAFSDMLVVDGVAMHYINTEALQIALGEWYPAS
ncbi:MAG: DUF4340 domain-containing protein [Eubacteriales bacterium]|nr:DUF4340 domain-containing protein [Eubacteriales bacterium]